MEGGNGMPGGILPSSMGSSGIPGLEMPLHQHHPPSHVRHIFPFQPSPPNDADQQPMGSAASYSTFCARGRQPSTLSSEDEHGGFGDEGDAAKRLSQSPSPSPSPWHRMKWTDSMVRLLISAVYHTGDDGGGGADGPHAPATSSSAAKGKKAGSGSASSASALLQKKGKWKSVSRAMMERGFFVSPQQCEDKFNDLNKRYKRVNELLGKGTACRVVENPALLDTMDHLTPNAKEEARKLLNSKHLFFREMCAYHNPPGAIAAASGAAASSCAPQHPPHAPLPSMAEDQRHCFYHPAGQGKGGGEAAGLEAMPEEEEEDDEDENLDDEEDDDDDYGDDDVDEDGGDDHQTSKHQKHEEVDQADEDEERKGFMGNGTKRARMTSRPFSSPASPPLSLSLSSTPSTSTYIQQLRSELMGLAGGGEPQQRQWLRRKAVELEEQRVGYQSRAFQLERQRLRWLRFSTNKEREMERMRLNNDRLRLENERMMLLLRQKELELTNSGAGDSSAGSRFQQKLMLPPANGSSADHHCNRNADLPPTAA